MPISPKNIVSSMMVSTIILPLLVQTHCTAALPNSFGDCFGDNGFCIKSPAIVARKQRRYKADEFNAASRKEKKVQGSHNAKRKQKERVCCEFLPQQDGDIR